MKNNRNARRRSRFNLLKSWLPDGSGLPKRNASAGRRREALGFERLEDRLVLSVVINEFLAENNSGIEDAAGHNHDWLELKNTGASAVDISGWYLTDDALDLTKFAIPNAGSLTVLDPGESLLVYASGNNGEVGLVGSEIHTNFQLSQEPGYLGLVQSNGITIEHEYNLYPQQSPDISYGLGVGVGSTTTETLLTAGTSATGDGSTAQFRPFDGRDADVDDHWTEIDYVATSGDGWITTTDGLGFGYSSPWQDSTVSLSGEIAGYVRMPFTVTDAAQLTSMTLELRVDNGYAVFLNGREIQRERIPTMFKIGNDWLDTKDWGGLNSRENLDDSVITGSPAVIDLTEWLDTIEEGDNVLAIYAANHTSDTGDYLVHAELTAERANGAVAETFMVNPTPALENGAGYLGVIEDTLFSHDRGFYDTPFALTISTVEPGTTIRYTTDGTRPTLTNGTTYSGPITIDPATLSYTDAGVVTIRAAAFKSGYFPTNIDTQSYIFLDEVLDQDGSGLPSYSSWGYAGADWEMDPNIVSSVGAENLKDDLTSIPTMSLVMDWEELFGDGSDEGIYTESSDWHEKSDERYASLEYFTDGLTEEFQIDSVVEIQGHSSTYRWRSDKLSFQVKFKQPYDTKLASDTLFGNSAVDGENAANDFDTLVLDAQYNYTFAVNNTTTQGPYATYLHDQVVADLTNLAGAEGPHGRWVNLYINGMYWGLYNAHERPGDAYAEEYYGGDKDDYLVVKGFEGRSLLHGGSQDKYQQDDGGLASMIAYEAFLDEVNDDMSNLTEYQQVADILDIDSFINYVVTLYYAGNYDWGELNWFASIDASDPNGQWHFHSWDQEHAFPNDQNAAAGDSRNQDYDHTAQVTNDFGEHEFGPTGIHHMLMESDEYRLRFSDRVEELMQNDGVLTPANAQAVWQARVDEIADAINGEAARWGDNRYPDKTGTTWATNVQYTTDHFFFANGFYDSRTDIVLDIFNNTLSTGVGKTDWLVNLAAPDFNQYGGEFTAGFDLSMSNSNTGGTIYYTLDGTDPRDASGGVSATALVYSGDIELTDSVQVRARVYDSSQSGTANDWSAEVDKIFTLDVAYPLRIVELMYNPTGSNELEYIELLNTGDQAIDLGNVQITDFSSSGYTFTSQVLSAGERIVVPENVVDFQALYPTVTNVTSTAYSGNLSNDGETVTLLDPLGNIIQSFTYDDEAGWPTGPDNGGPSLEYAGPLDAGEDPLNGSPADPFDDPTNWQASAQSGGSPGVDGTVVEDADFDDDTFVTGSDFMIWQRNVGRTTGVSNATGDANGDNLVNADDLAIWRLQFGTTIPVTVPLASSTSAPLIAEATLEPALAVSQTDVLAAALLDLRQPKESPAVEAVYAEEDVSFALEGSGDEWSELAVVEEKTAQDEALSLLGSGESEEAASLEVALALLDEDIFES